MPTCYVACVRAGGSDLTLVPVDPPFGRLPLPEQLAWSAALQRYANSAGLTGEVVPVWPADGGCMAYLARPSLHRVVGELDLGFVARYLNYRLVVGPRAGREERDPRSDSRPGGAEGKPAGELPVVA